MIEADKRKAIFLLHQEGMPLREIARRLQVSRNTVAVVIAQRGQLPKLVRAPKQKIDSQLLQDLYEQCDGWIQRMHEKLAEEQGIEVKYSTLTRMLRHLGISKSQQSRCSQVPDEPGIDIGAKHEIYSIIDELAKEGLEVLLVSSELEEIINLCDTVCVMRRGWIVKTLTREQLSQEMIMQYAAGAENIADRI